MKQPKPDVTPNTSDKKVHAAPLPHSTKDFPLHGQTESTPGREQVREEMHTKRSPRESKRPIERTASHKKS